MVKKVKGKKIETAPTLNALHFKNMYKKRYKKTLHITKANKYDRGYITREVIIKGKST